MILSDELYFEITVSGKKAELRKFASFLTSGELDGDFEITEDYIIFEDEYDGKSDEEESSFVFSNDDIGLEIDRFDPSDFLDVFCKAAENLDVDGQFYDINDEEYRFVSPVGDGEYSNGKSDTFNDELDQEAYEEEKAEREAEDY